MRIAYDNAYDTAELSVTSERANYPVSNTQVQRLGAAWRSTDTAAQTITAEFSVGATDKGVIAIMGHNLTSGATVTVEHNTADSWTAPAVSESLTIHDGMILKFYDSAASGGESLATEADLLLLTEADEEILVEFSDWPFTRIVFTDAANPDGYIKVGRVWVGNYIDISPASLANFTVTKRTSDTVVYGKDRQKYATPGVSWRRFDLTFPPTDGVMLAEIQDMYDTVGNHTSIVFANFDELRSTDGVQYTLVEPVYCSIVGDVDFRRRGNAGMRFDYKIVLEEDK